MGPVFKCPKDISGMRSQNISQENTCIEEHIES